jgi:N-methylhydantoinase B
MDPILAEVVRTRVDAIGLEAAAAVERTAISPIVTESKDYSITFCDENGALISATGAVQAQFGASRNAIRAAIARFGADIAPGDVFVANDPHSGGGLHPQDVVIEQPVFVGHTIVGWIAICAHMMDMGGMRPGSSAPDATECYQEALRLPPVRLFAGGVETDVWAIIRNNIRSAPLVEMDLRSLVIGAAVAAEKLASLVADVGPGPFREVVSSLIDATERLLRERITLIEDGRYRTLGWVEYGPALFRVPCVLAVCGDRLIYDLTEAPPQAPHYFNSRPYIVQAAIIPRLLALLAPELPLNEALYRVVEVLSRPGTIVDSRPPAPIGAAHMDATLAVTSAAGYCLQLALHASPKAVGRDYATAPPLGAYGTGRWSYPDENGQMVVFTFVDGAFGGSPGGGSRDGVDLSSSLTPSGLTLEYADIEILEAAYPVLFQTRRVRHAPGGAGRYRSGGGCEEAFTPHGVPKLMGSMTGTRAWFPAIGAAGGMPGATTRFSILRTAGYREELTPQARGLVLSPGDLIELRAASGGGFGDPLDRDLENVQRDLLDGRLDRQMAIDHYGVVFTETAKLSTEASEARRADLRRDRLFRAEAPAKPVDLAPRLVELESSDPLYPGIVQCGRYAIAERSGAVLAIAPDNWLDGCPVLSSPLDGQGPPIIQRSYLDPLSGALLFTSVDQVGEGAPIGVWPERWTNAGDVVSGRTPSGALG